MNANPVACAPQSQQQQQQQQGPQRGPHHRKHQPNKRAPPVIGDVCDAERGGVGPYLTGYGLSYILPAAVPFGLMPPPPHSPAVQHQGLAGARRGCWRSGQDLRCNSPHGSESDESCRSYKSRDSPPSIIYGSNNKGRNNRNYNENSLISKFSNSTPNVFYQSLNHSYNYVKPNKYFINNSSHSHNHNNQHNNNNNNNNATDSPHQQQLHQFVRHYQANIIAKKKPFAVDINRRLHGLMERFTTRAYLFKIPANPPGLLGGDEWDTLNRSIWDVYQAKAQTETTYLRKLELWKKLYLSIHTILVRFSLYLVGSSMSGMGLDSSDIDMCLLVRPYLQDARTDALAYLKNICNMLECCDFVKSPEVIMAKVPILKFRDAEHGFEVDLNCNNSVGIRNTHLLNCYARLDWRVRPLVAVVKLWAQANDINDAKRMTISSYSLALMVIHYLQCGVTPPAIPCLQGLYPRHFSNETEIYNIDIQEEMPPFYSDNRQSIGELFVGFLGYYARFDYERHAVSVREGCLLPVDDCRRARAPKNDQNQWKLLCIEEPFDRTNTARAVFDPDTFEHIKSVFRLSHEALGRTRNLSSVLGGAEAPPGRR